MKQICILLTIFQFLILYSFYSEAYNLNDDATLQGKFESITIDNGLSNNSIRDIIQDSRGYIWIATEDGLNKYDGYTFSKYNFDFNNANSISANIVRCIFEDSRGNIWAGTNKGLSMYRDSSDDFKNYLPEKGTPYSLQSNEMLSIGEDVHGNLLIGTINKGIGLKPAGKDTFYHAGNPHPDFPFLKKLSGLVVNDIMKDNKGNCWFATASGTFVVNKKGRIKYHFTNDNDNENENENNNYTKYIIPGDGCKSLLEDSKGRVWIGSKDGLIGYIPEKDSVLIINDQHQEKTGIELSVEAVTSIEEGMNGEIWAGTHYGLNRIDFKNKTNQYYFSQTKLDFTINESYVNNILYDNSGNIWVGTPNHGLNKFNYQHQRFDNFKSYFYKEKMFHNIHSNYIKSFEKAGNHKIWVSHGVGIDILDFKNRKKKFISMKLINKKIKKLYPEEKYDNLSTVYIKKIGNIIWINGLIRYNLSQDHFLAIPESLRKYSSELKNTNAIKYNKPYYYFALSGGLIIYNQKTGKTRLYTANEDSPVQLSYGHIQDIYIQEDKNLIWAGTRGKGLNIIDPEKNTIKIYSPEHNQESGFNGEFGLVFFEDSQERLWIGTKNNGLFLYKKEDHRFINFREKDGLLSNRIKAIEEDNKGNLWLSSSRGITKFNPETKKCHNFGKKDGLQGNTFNIHASLKDSEGYLYFGGINGFNRFKPEKIKPNSFKPIVNLTNIKISNISKEQQYSYLDKLRNDSSLSLSYEQNSFTIEFSAMHYAFPLKNKYAYKLIGFNNDWTYSKGSRRYATYTNLPPGKYTFLLKAANCDDVWNEPKAFTFIIKTPYWRTWWFLSICGFVITGIIFVFFRAQINRAKRQKLEKEVKERTKELEQKNHQIYHLYTELQDNIKTALIIQESILPVKEKIKQYFKDFLLFFKPKDVVSGDFYWYYKTENYLYIAAVDCTGHGVAGGFMSMVGFNLLNNAIEKKGEPSAAEVLNYLNHGVIEMLQQNDNNTDSRDGMDITLCKIDLNSLTVNYASACNPLYLIRNGELEIHKADKFSIGIPKVGTIKDFTDNYIQLQNNDVFYLISDGYPDQLGGENQEKFYYPYFRELLVNIHKKPMDEQYNVLNKKLEEWKGDLEQTDDILILGFKV